MGAEFKEDKTIDDYPVLGIADDLNLKFPHLKFVLSGRLPNLPVECDNAMMCPLFDQELTALYGQKTLMDDFYNGILAFRLANTQNWLVFEFSGKGGLLKTDDDFIEVSIDKVDEAKLNIKIDPVKAERHFNSLENLVAGINSELEKIGCKDRMTLKDDRSGFVMEVHPSNCYYILSRKWTAREDNNLTWWGPDQSGYVYDIDKAGVYSKETAFSISKGVHGSSIPVSVDDVNLLATRMVYKSDAALKILYSEHPDYDYKEESRPNPTYCEHCGEAQ